ncbi:hypothetical protein SSAG_04670 [Streptomyces sp. Mg1]|nr:hypothetical protein SSAG_04670 [Streptomyces sp. Mg1]
MLGDLVLAQVVELGEQRVDPVEGAGDGVRPALDAPLQVLGVPLEAVVALCPAERCLIFFFFFVFGAPVLGRFFFFFFFFMFRCEGLIS